jgi:hypothetical protein
LSTVGVYGGNISIIKDQKRSGANNSVAAKPSLNGATAMKLFKESAWSGQDKAWKDVVRSENNQVANGAGYLARVEMWQALEDIIPYLTGLVLKEGQSAADFRTKVQKWGKLFIRCFGEEHVTHYVVSIPLLDSIIFLNASCFLNMDASIANDYNWEYILGFNSLQHILVKHAPWFVGEYGSLNVWSCQGMEKSHYAAKAAYQALTQHGGTRNKTSAILQLYEHWYRNIQHRFARKAERERLLAEPVDTEKAARMECCRVASNAPSAIEGRSRWHAQRVRIGRAWKVPREEEVLQSMDCGDRTP